MQEENRSEVSEFRAGSLSNEGEINFSQARQLETGGSICDAYEARHHRRRVFVKRLKKEYRNSSLHRAALDKEFDVGITLNHKSLPRYLEFHDNYILMDYIEGDSLHKMMLTHDPWLNSEKHLWRFLRQLLEVTDYLHNRHIVHCDIKPDNILLTYEERNVVLIDLDKCHTDWLDDTSGKQHFRNGGDSPEGVSTDFEAIGGIIDLWMECIPILKKKSIIKFCSLCNKKNVTFEELKDYIDNHNSKSSVKYFLNPSVAAIILAAALAAGILLFQKIDPEKSNEEISERIVEIADSIADVPVVATQEPEKVKVPVYETTPMKERSIYDVIESFADKSFSRNNAPTMKAIAEFKEICLDSSLTNIELYSRIPDLTNLYYKAFYDTRSEILEEFPDVDTKKIDDAIIISKSFQNYMKEWKETLEIINKRGGVSKIVSDSLNHLN